MFTGIAALGGSAPHLGAQPVQDGYPSWSPDGSRIVFESTRDGNREIYVMRSDGSEIRRLTRDPGYDRVPSYAPDGRAIVFQSTRHSNAFRGPLTYQIYVMDEDGGNVRRLTRNGANDVLPRFSPDGRRILFVSDRDGTPEVHVMLADGSGQTNLTADPGLGDVLAAGEERSNPHWTADGRGILFDTVEAETGTWHVFRLDLGSGELDRLDHGVPGVDGAAAFFATASPDGSLVGMGIDQDPDGNGNWEIWLADLRHGTFRRLTNQWGNDFWQQFSPDGREITFASNRDGTYAIYRMSVAGGVAVKLTQR